MLYFGVALVVGIFYRAHKNRDLSILNSLLISSMGIVAYIALPFLSKFYYVGYGLLALIVSNIIVMTFLAIKSWREKTSRQHREPLDYISIIVDRTLKLTYFLLLSVAVVGAPYLIAENVAARDFVNSQIIEFYESDDYIESYQTLFENIYDPIYQELTYSEVTIQSSGDYLN